MFIDGGQIVYSGALDQLVEDFAYVQGALEDLTAQNTPLIRVFSQTYGIAPHQYLISRRVEHARRLLSTGHRPAEAAALAGFHDQAHLTRHFLNRTGLLGGS